MVGVARSFPILPFAAILSASAPPIPADPRPCVDWDRVVTRAAPAPDRLDLRLTGGRRYRSVLPAACPKLQELDGFHTIQLDRQDADRVCAGDRFRMVNTTTLRTTGTRPNAICRFGPFVPLPPGG